MRKYWCIALPALCGFAFLLWLSSCARLTYDDYLFAACFKNHSFGEAVGILSNTHTFRWTTFLLQDLMFGLVPGQYFPLSIFLFFFLFYILWIQQLHKLTRTLFERFAGTKVDKTLSLSMASLFITAIYFSASQAIENFTFSGAACDRLLPLLFITMIANVFLSTRKGWPPILKLTALALLLAGTAENVTLSVAIALLMYMAWQKWITKKTVEPSAIIFTLLLPVFFSLEMLSPGSDSRYKAEKIYHFTCGDDNAYCADTLSLFLSRFFQWRQLFVLPLVAMFFIVCAKMPDEARKALSHKSKKALVFLAAVFVAVGIMHVVTTQWIFECYGPMRIWFPLNVMMVVAVMVTAVLIAGKTNRVSGFIHIAFSLISIGVIAFYFGRHFEATNAYRAAYDKRISKLLQTKSAEVVEVEALPPPDLVVEGDVMPDENDDVNRDFTDTYRLPFKVRRK